MKIIRNNENPEASSYFVVEIQGHRQGGFGWFGRIPFQRQDFYKLKITPNLTALELSGSYLPTTTLEGHI